MVYEVALFGRELTVDFNFRVQSALVHSQTHSLTLVVFAVVPVAHDFVLTSIVGLLLTNVGEWSDD